MKTENIADTLEENISSSGKLFSETYSSMADIYRKQMEIGLDLFTNFLTPLKTGKVASGFNPEVFSSGSTLLKKNFEHMAEQSRNIMSTFLNLYSGKPTGREDGEEITGSVFNAYKLQMKQISDINQKFFKTFNETFKTAHIDFDNLYDSFHKSTEENLTMAEEGIKNALNTYVTISGRSSKDFQKMLETANKQIESLAKNNMTIWSELIQSAKKETKKPATKAKSK